MDTTPSHPNHDISSPGIELTLRNLSLSIVPPPSLLIRTARKLRLTADPYKQQPTSSDVGTGTGDTDGATPKTGSDLRNVGINIYRSVDLTVKPGQGIHSIAIFTFWLPSKCDLIKLQLCGGSSLAFS